MPRCTFCRTKTVMEFACDCKGGPFCVKCRLPEVHTCTLDFQSRGKAQLEQSLVKVEASKVAKI
jgi:predicted nucleic acid binding AN1-type Zn finger protein